MDLWTPEVALRSKEQVIHEDWKAPDMNTAWLKKAERHSAPAPANIETWTTLNSHALTIFYQAHSSPPIPSTKDIDDAPAKNRLHTNIGLHLVCKIGDTVVKYSASPNVVEEAENLLFLAEKRPELRIPTVLAVWSTIVDSGTTIYCLMMNFIEGINMDDEKFAKLSIYAQNTICAKVSSQLRYLRELPSEGYYGRPHGKGWVCPPPGLDTNTGASRVVIGPYKTYEEYCSAMYRVRQVQSAIGCSGLEWPLKEPELMAQFTSARVFPSWEHHEPKFTWIDPSITNMIARQIKGDDGSEDWEVFLIDWEFTGWYPAWLQGMQFCFRGGIVLRDPKQPTKVTFYRRSEIIPMMLKDFDPEPDQKRIAIICDLDWSFY